MKGRRRRRPFSKPAKAPLQTPGEGVYAVGALQGVRDGEADERLLATRERAVLLTRLVPGHELLEQIGPVLADLREAPEVVFFVVGHCAILLERKDEG